MIFRQEPDWDPVDDPPVPLARPAGRNGRRREAARTRLWFYLSFVWIYCLALSGSIFIYYELQDRYPALADGWAVVPVVIVRFAVIASITLPIWILLRSLRTSTAPWSRSA